MSKELGWIESETWKDGQDVRWLVTYKTHVFLYAYVYVSWAYEVLIWVIIVFIGSLSSFMKLRGQTSKNVHDVWKVCLKTTLCVLACIVEFYVFVFDEIDMRGTKLVQNHIRVGNAWEKVPKD